MTITKQQLMEDRDTLLGQLSEHDELMRQLSAVEMLLTSRFGWSAHDKADQTAPTEDGDDPPVEGVPYSVLAREWMSQSAGAVTIRDFRSFVQKKHGRHSVNINSMNGAFRRYVGEGALKLKKAGSGRIPSIYEIDRPDGRKGAEYT